MVLPNRSSFNFKSEEQCLIHVTRYQETYSKYIEEYESEGHLCVLLEGLLAQHLPHLSHEHHALRPRRCIGCDGIQLC
jgi:hypothetical protein